MIWWKRAVLALACFGTANAARGEAFTCASCHSRQVNSFPGNAMSHALQTAAQCDILRGNPVLTATLGRYSYKIERRGAGSVYTVTDGEQTLTVPLVWAFGIDRGGQTYVFKKDGALFESRVSYYKELKGLDWTIGAANSTPGNLMEAAGRAVDDSEQARCFGCHATHAVSHGRAAFDTLVPGVQCERCHAGADEHRRSFATAGASPAAMKRLGDLTAEGTSNLCGQCHRTWEQIAMNGPMTVANVRFQPYRLTKSKCYDTEDRRISCVACHDPHKPLDEVTANYDTKCRACHAENASRKRGDSGGNEAKAKLCRVGKKDCASCHMPKVELPASHKLFTDHMIRIARPGEAYPE